MCYQDDRSFLIDILTTSLWYSDRFYSISIKRYNNVTRTRIYCLFMDVLSFLNNSAPNMFSNCLVHYESSPPTHQAPLTHYKQETRCCLITYRQGGLLPATVYTKIPLNNQSFFNNLFSPQSSSSPVILQAKFSFSS